MGSKLLYMWKKGGIAVLTGLLFVFFAIAEPSFINGAVLLNILRQSSVLGTCIIGVTFIMISGSCDLSVGSIVAFVCVVVCLLTAAGMSIALAIIIALAAGIIASTINGVLAVLIKTHPFIITLATMNIWSGIAYLISDGKTLYNMPDGLSVFGQGVIFDVIPIITLIFIVMAALGTFILKKTYFGRYVYAFGGNKEAARLAGINVNKVQILTHMIGGIFMSVGGILLVSRTMAGFAGSANTYALDCIIAACLGGISINGGEGKMWGAILGVIALQILFNGMVMLGVNDFWQKIAKGMVLIIAITIDALQRRTNIVAKLDILNENYKDRTIHI